MEPVQEERLSDLGEALRRVLWWKDRIRAGDHGPFLVDLRKIERHARTELAPEMLGPVVDIQTLRAFLGLAEDSIERRILSLTVQSWAGRVSLDQTEAYARGAAP
jgi:hypothetical protein